MLMDFDRNSMTAPVQSSDYTKSSCKRTRIPLTMEAVTQTNAVKFPIDSPANYETGVHGGRDRIE